MQKTLLILLGLSVAACSTVGDSALTLPPKNGPGPNNAQLPIYGPLIPSGAVAISPNNIYSLETIAGAAIVVGLIYLVYDPLAPNWSLEEKALNSDTYSLSMRAKSFRTGGDGEAMMILKRRALQLQRENGYASYRILDYSEGIESSTPFTHRFSEGTIQLVRADALPKKR
jgi:hypothetical protein